MDCMAGFCLGDDPDPGAIGIYIASTINAENCFGDEVYSDTDGDGLADICEENIAATFNPELRYCSCDVVWGGEPVYVVKPVTYANGQRVVRIMYMPAYYADGGDYYWGGGHFGDSEAIILDVRYDPDTEHWTVNAIFLSQHTSYFFYIYGNGYDEDGDNFFDEHVNINSTWFNPLLQWTDGLYPDQFDYVGDKGGGVPIIWVAPSKHANYPNEAACDDGGGRVGFGEDDCYGNASFAYMSLSDGSVGPRNLGSSGSHRLNCLATNNPVMEPYNHPECFWTDAHFTGWSGNTDWSTPYSLRLGVWNF